MSSLPPLPAGEQYDDPATIPDELRPIRRPIPVENVPLSQDRNAFGARKGRDGVTRWCYSCDTTLDPGGGRSFCPICLVQRNTKSQSRLRAANQPVTLRREDARKIIDSTAKVAEAITQAVLQFDRDYMTDTWIDELMLATKELTRDVQMTLGPALDARPRQQSPRR